MTIARRTTFAALLADPDLPAMASRYAAYATDELQGRTFDMNYYLQLDAVPACSAFEVRDGQNTLTGFAVVFMSERPHSRTLAATVESIYAESRGLALRTAIEQYARKCGAEILLMSAPVGSRASAALVKTGMRICSSLHIKAL